MTTASTFGIDLGTTHCCLATVDAAGKAVIIRHPTGVDVIPSAVYFEAPEKVSVGAVAKDAAVIAPHLVAQLTKRLMGRENVAGTYYGREYSPEEIAALVLRELVNAGRENGYDVRNVVITVPASFGIGQRAATRRAGEIAGLNVLDILDEPVAAALHYHAVKATSGVRHVLVCDLGGGTYDTSVIQLDGDDVQVVCTAGDRELGGADWDARVRAYLSSCFSEQHPRLDPSRDEVFGQELANMAERLKKELTKAEARHQTMRFGGASARVELTRSKLEELTSDLLDRVVARTADTVAIARSKGVFHFDDVVLVGGMSKMPAVARLLKERLGLEGRCHEPDLAVAKGAALYALLQRIQDGSNATAVAEQLGMTSAEVASLATKRVTTVTPRAFGIMGIDPRDPLALTDPLHARKMIAHLLPANTRLPADTGPYPFAVTTDKQRMAQIDVWEQVSEHESEELADNVRIGSGMLRHLPPRPAGSPFEVTFYMSETGNLTVHAREPESGAEVRFDLQIGNMNQSAVDEARNSIAHHEVSG